MNLDDFFYASCEAKNAQKLSKHWLSFISEFGISCFTMSELSLSPHDGAHRLDLMVNYPQDWLARYQEKQYEKHDPVIRMGFQEKRPFTWAEALDRYHDPMAAAIMGEARDFGLTSGIAFESRQSDGRLIGFSFSGSERKIRSSSADLRIINVAAIEFYTRYEELSGTGEKYRPELTIRELEVLRWISAGKTKAQVADILCVSESCVKRYCESIFRKLGANSLVYAVGRAIGLGLIDPP